MSWTEGLDHIIRENEPIAPHTWFRLGGPAQYFAEPTNEEELAVLVQRCREEDLRVRLLGGGSNVLADSKGVPGVVISISTPDFCDIRRKGSVIEVGGGARLSHVISTAAREGLAGIESLVGIPGTVGGALHGNAGSHGTDVGQWCCHATVLTRAGELLTRESRDLRFAYRQSSLNELVIVRARFALEEEDPVELTRRMQKAWIVKRQSQPATDHGFGCIFKDPQGMTASELVEQAGFKGMRVGGASVSEVHANFVIAESGATSDDVRHLISMITTRVSANFDVELECQLEIW